MTRINERPWFGVYDRNHGHCLCSGEIRMLPDSRRRPVAPANAPTEGIAMGIGKFCNRDVVCATRDSTVVEAAELMRRHHVGAVVVVEETASGRKPVGIVTDRDIVVEIVCASLDPKLVKVSDLLLRPLVTANEHTAYANAVHLMAAEGVRRIPVVNDAGMLVGIITFDDLFHQLAVPFAELSDLAMRERQREAVTRR